MERSKRMLLIRSEGCWSSWTDWQCTIQTAKAESDCRTLNIRHRMESRYIYVCGYDNKAKWKKVLGSQVGCVYIDEVNIADMEFLREITHRCKYMITTSNPDAPDIPVYKEFINRSRPLKKYVKGLSGRAS